MIQKARHKMDENSEQGKLVKIKKENKVLSKDEIKNSADKMTGQLKFISPEIQVQALIKDIVLPIFEEKYDKQINELKKSNEKIEESNQEIKEINHRLSNSFEKALPHLENKMIGNEKEAFQVWSDNPENADIARFNSSAPAEVVYEFISADLAKIFGCKTCYVSMLLKDLELWTDDKYSHNNRVHKNGTVKKFRRNICNETYERLSKLIDSKKWSSYTEKRKEVYLNIYENMKFFRS